MYRYVLGQLLSADVVDYYHLGTYLQRTNTVLGHNCRGHVQGNHQTITVCEQCVAILKHLLFASFLK